MFGTKSIPKSNKGLVLDTYYTDQNQKNIDFFDSVDKRMEETRREFTFEKTGNRDDEESGEIKEAFSIEKILKVFSIDQGMFSSFLEEFQVRSVLPKEVLACVKEKEMNIEEFPDLDLLLDYIKLYKLHEKAIENRFFYSPHIKKYVNTIYPGQFFKAYPIFKSRIGEIDEVCIDGLIEILPKNVTVKKQNTCVETNPVEFHSLVEIELQTGEKVDLMSTHGNTLFFAIEAFDKNIYNFCRSVCISYVEKYQNNFNKKVISLLDLGVLKRKIGIKDFWNNSNKHIDHKDFFTHFGALDDYKKSFKEKGLGYESNDMDLYDYIQDYIIRGETKKYKSKIIKNDEVLLEKGLPINLMKYALNLEASGTIFIDDMKSYITKNPKTSLVNNSNIKVKADFIRKLLKSVGFDASHLFNQSFKVNQFKQELEDFFGLDGKEHTPILTALFLEQDEELCFEQVLESLISDDLNDIISHLLSSEDVTVLREIFKKNIGDMRVQPFYKRVLSISASGRKNSTFSEAEVQYCKLLEKQLIKGMVSDMEKKTMSFDDAPFCFFDISKSKFGDRKYIESMGDQIQKSFGKTYVTVFNRLVKDFYASLNDDDFYIFLFQFCKGKKSSKDSYQSIVLKDIDQEISSFFDRKHVKRFAGIVEGKYRQLDEQDLLDTVLSCKTGNSLEKNFLYLMEQGFYEKILGVFQEHKDLEKIQELQEKRRIDPYSIDSKYIYYLLKNIDDKK